MGPRVSFMIHVCVWGKIVVNVNRVYSCEQGGLFAKWRALFARRCRKRERETRTPRVQRVSLLETVCWPRVCPLNCGKRRKVFLFHNPLGCLLGAWLCLFG